MTRLALGLRKLIPLICLLCVTSVDGWYRHPSTLAEAVDQAGLIFLGRVTSRVSGLHLETDGASTCYEFKLLETLKGRVEGDTMTLTVPGGVVDGDKIGFVKFGPFPLSYHVGEIYLVFVKESSSSYFTRTPFYHYDIQRFDLPGDNAPAFFADGRSKVITGIGHNDFIFERRDISRLAEDSDALHRWKFDPELIKQYPPPPSADTILADLRWFIQWREGGENFRPGKTFSAPSLQELRYLYNEGLFAPVDDLSGCVVH